jgi:hypothetical protein
MPPHGEPKGVVLIYTCALATTGAWRSTVSAEVVAVERALRLRGDGGDGDGPLERLRDAVYWAQRSGHDLVTLSGVLREAHRAKLAELELRYNEGRAFPPRDGDLKPGRRYEASACVHGIRLSRRCRQCAPGARTMRGG